MWSGDMYWLPLILNDKKIEADFFFDNEDQLINYEIRDLVQTNQ